jgi:hypothetical protein
MLRWVTFTVSPKDATLHVVEKGITVRNLLFGFLIILAAAVVTGTAGSRGGSGGSRGSASNAADSLANAATNRTGVACTVVPNRIRHAGGRIIAGGRYLCDNPGPEKLNMLVEVQKQGAGGKWTVVSVQRVITSGKATTRDTSQANRTRETSLACADGTYRAAISAYTVSRGKTREYTQSSSAVKNPC